jgi:hypothetical protein
MRGKKAWRIDFTYYMEVMLLKILPGFRPKSLSISNSLSNCPERAILGRVSAVNIHKVQQTAILSRHLPKCR